MKILCLRNRQRTRAVDTRLLRRIARDLLTELLSVRRYELGVHIVADEEMTCVNETFLKHAGSTDVITFPHASNRRDGCLHGEIFICVDEAVLQARRYRTAWQSELARYLVHGLLHLRGFDDASRVQRARMKREEGRLLRTVARRFPLSKLSRKRKLKR